jgi:filamentous hemagglutinin family protein
MMFSRSQHVRLFPAAWINLLIAAHQLISGDVWSASSIVRDGSLGTGPTTSLSVSGSISHNAVTYNKIAIPETYGQRSGTNVFHSFSSFNVGAGDGAVFSISAPANNVISRVTGGTVSMINGLISLDTGSTISAPNFFFINPAGVAFGAGAAVDVPAAFHVSTADYLKFPDGNFYADTSRASTFSAMDPVAFGFLGGTLGSISISGGVNISTQNGNISLVSGDVSLDYSLVGTQGGDIRVVALGRSTASREVGLATAITNASGSLTMTNYAAMSAVATGTQSGGNISVSAGNVTLDSGTIWTQSQPGATSPIGNVEVGATGNILLTNGGQIGSATVSTSNAGQVSVSAARVTVDGYLSGIFDEAQASTGNGGVLSVTTTGNLTLRNKGGIDADTYGGGHGGIVNLHVGGDLSLSSGGYIDAVSSDAGNAGGINVAANRILLDRTGSVLRTGIYTSGYGSSGNAGFINLTTLNDLTVLGGAAVNASTFSAGNAGPISINARSVLLDTQNASSTSSINAYAFNGSLGDAGSITINTTGNVSLLNGANINAGTYSSGNAGQIAMNVGSLTLNSTAGSNRSFAGAFSDGTGHGGRISIIASGNVSLLNGSYLTSSAYASGHGGSVNLTAKTLDIDGQGNAPSGIFSVSTASGHAGDISVTTSGDLNITNKGLISSSAYSSGNAGSVVIHSYNTRIDAQGDSYTGIISDTFGAGNAGSVSVSTQGDLTILNGGTIDSSTYFGSGNGGNIHVVAGGNLSLSSAASFAKKSQISSLTYTSGNAGSLDISASNIYLEGRDTGIYSYTGNGGTNTGNGGNITVNAPGVLSLMNGGNIDAGSNSQGNGGIVRINVGSIYADGYGAAGGQFTGITNSATAAGSSGEVYVTASGDIRLLNAAQIASGAYGTGSIGRLLVTANNITIDGHLSGIGSSTDPLSSGNGGAVAVNANGNIVVSDSGYIGSVTAGSGAGGAVSISAQGDLSVLSGGIISSGTIGSGVAGALSVTAKSILVLGSNTASPSTINALAAAGSSGQTGDVTVEARDSITIANGGQISIQNDAVVANQAGIRPSTLKVAAPTINLKDAQITASSSGNLAASNIAIHFNDLLNIDPSAISTSANIGNGGSISIVGNGTLILDRSQITTSVLGLAGNGGDISIRANTLVMNSGFIQANTAATNAQGGAIAIDVNAIVTSGNMLFLGGATPYSFQPDVFGFNVIQAAAPSGLSGVVQVTSPIMDVSGTLTALNAKMIGSAGPASSPCQATSGSSMVQTGRGGLAPLARDLLGPPGGVPGSTPGSPANSAMLIGSAMPLSTQIGKCSS